jgi:VCBS repeat protein
VAFGSFDKQSTLYLNNGSTFSSDPVWFSGREHDYIRGVALADLNGDGHPDLVTASNGGTIGGVPHYSVMFPSQGGTLAPVPGWQTDGGYFNRGVALGDLDGDGDLDLAFGGTLTTVFRNDDGVPSARPVWMSVGSRNTNSIALGDVDGDGDLDLAVGELGNCRLYRNDGGQLTMDFVWSNTSPAPLYARNLALTDVDGDGDVDLLCADAFRGAILYRNDRGAFTSDAVWAQDSTDVTYWVATGDVDDDGDLDVVAGNSLVGGPPRSSTLFLGVRNPPMKGDPASPVNHLPNTDAFLRSLRTELSPNRIHVTGLAVDPESDPVWIVVDYQYKGGSVWTPVDMGAIASRLGPLPSSPGGTAFQFDWDLSDVPFDTRDVVLRCRVISNPMRVGVTKQIVSYLKELGPITNIVRPMIAVGPGISFPTISVYDTARGTCRISNKGTDLLHVGPMTIAGSNDAWVEPNIFNLPPRSSQDVTLFWRPTSENPVSGSIVVPSNDPLYPLTSASFNGAIRRVQFTVTATTGEITQGIPVTALVTMLDSVRVDSVLVAYHAGERAEDAHVKLAKIQEGKNEQWFGAIPAESLRASGIEYVVEAHKGLARFPDMIRRPRVRINNLSFPETQPARSYTMLSIPLQTSGSIFDILSDDLGPPLPTSWRIFTYEPADSSYKEASASGGEVFDFEQGRSYWLISSVKATLDLEPRSGLSTPLDSAFVRTLKPGWNQVGDPFAFAVPWVDIMQASNIQGTLVEPPLRWVRAARTYAEVDSLLPFEGCFIKDNGPGDVVLRVPPPSSAPAAPSALRGRSQPSGSETTDVTGWQIQIVASCGDARDAENMLGIQRGALLLRDPWDRSDPPLGPWPGISVYFPHQDPKGNAFYLTRDFQDQPEATGPNGNQWSLDLFRSAGSDPSPQEVVLRFQGLEQVPADLRVVLLDRTLHREIDLRATSDYSFFQAPQPYRSEPEARFRLLVGSPEYVRSAQEETQAPKLTRLLPSRPNPFRSASVIRYDLATAGPVQIQIFDVRGRLLKTFDAIQGAPGRFEVMWRGETDRGGAVPAGVYFCRFSAPSVRQTLKMIRVE